MYNRFPQKSLLHGPKQVQSLKYLVGLIVKSDNRKSLRTDIGHSNLLNQKLMQNVTEDKCCPAIALINSQHEQKIWQIILGKSNTSVKKKAEKKGVRDI